MHLTLEPLVARAFAPFGRLVDPPAPGGEAILHDCLGPSLAAARFCAKLDTHAPKTLPFEAPAMERHTHSEQLFVPLGSASFAIAACLPDSAGDPDLSTLQGFVARGQTGICYSRGVWHLPITILERPATFLMMMMAVGDPAIDTAWATLPEPLVPQPAAHG